MFPNVVRSVALTLLVSMAAAAQEDGRSAPAEPDAAAAALLRLVRDTAAGGPTAFTATWQWKAAEVAFRKAAAAPPAAEPTPQRASGTFGKDRLHVRFDGTPSLELAQFGRHLLLREGEGPFRLASQHTTALAERPFAVDPELLLRALAAAAPRVADRSIGERDGEPVELFALCLDDAQVATLQFAGAIGDPNPIPASMRQLAERRGAAHALPAATVDVAVEVDVASRRLRRIHVRVLAPQLDSTRLRQILGGRGAPDPDELAAAPQEPPPTSFRDGLPVRETGDRMLRFLEFCFHDHGKATADGIEQFEAAAAELLGR